MNTLPTAEQPDLLTPKEAAQILRVTPGTLGVWRCNKRYALPYVKRGRNVLYRAEDVQRFIEKMELKNA